MIGDVHDRKYYGFSDAGFFIYDFDENRSAFATTTVSIQGIYSDEEDDTLYLIQGISLTKWNEGASRLTGRWKTKKFQLRDEVDWSIGELISDTYPMTVKFIANGSEVFSKTVADAEEFRCIPMRPNKVWEFEFQGQGDVTRFSVSTSVGSIMVA
jgi:hypothetical protein